MPQTPPLDIPRASYGLKMAGVVVLGLVIAGATTAALGGSGRAVASACLTVAVGSMLTFLPAVLRIRADYWGVAVLVAGMARSLLILAIAYSMTHGNGDLPARPLFIGALVGAVAILIAESALAISVLAHWDRQRTALKHAEPHA